MSNRMPIGHMPAELQHIIKGRMGSGAAIELCEGEQVIGIIVPPEDYHDPDKRCCGNCPWDGKHSDRKHAPEQLDHIQLAEHAKLAQGCIGIEVPEAHTAPSDGNRVVITAAYPGPYRKLPLEEAQPGVPEGLTKLATEALTAKVVSDVLKQPHVYARVEAGMGLVFYHVAVPGGAVGTVAARRDGSQEFYDTTGTPLYARSRRAQAMRAALVEWRKWNRGIYP